MAVLVVVGGAIACGSLPRTNYYTLRIPAAPASHNPKSAAVLGIERLGAPEVLRDDRIVFYESPTQLNFYQYHRWSADPATMLRDAIARRLSQAGVFAEVRLLPACEPVDYFLRGRVLHFEEVDYDSGVKGRAGLELTLVRARDRKVLWTASGQAQSPAQGQGTVAVVEALNAASDQVLNELVPRILAQAEEDIGQGAPSSP